MQKNTKYSECAESTKHLGDDRNRKLTEIWFLKRVVLSNYVVYHVVLGIAH